MTETDLRWQLRQLPREMDPGRDLWPGIAAGIERRPARRSFTWPRAFALAASVLLGAGLFLKLQAPQQAPPADPTALLVQREAIALSREYEAALLNYRGAPMPASLEPGLATLDRSAAQIRLAIAANPDSRALLKQLQRTYARRLELTQRGLTG
jgi:hypothetical protein